MKSQTFSGLCGIATVLLLMGGITIADWNPPIPPLATPAEVAALYRDHGQGLLIGAICFMFASATCTTFAAGISAELRAIEHKPVYTYIQMATGAGGAILLAIPPIFWSTASYRSDLTPEMLRTINDMAAFAVACAGSLAAFQYLSAGLAILSDPNRKPVFPRWFGWFSLIAFCTTVPMVFVGLSKSGAFAWNGLVPHFIGSIPFVPWYFIMGIMLIRKPAVPMRTIDADEPDGS